VVKTGLKRVVGAIAASVVTLAVSLAALADGSPPITTVPATGAFSAQFIEDRDHVSIMNFSGNYNRQLTPVVSNVEPRAVIARKFYENHPDEYDFLVVFSTFEFDTGDADWFNEDLARYRALSPSDIRAAAETFLPAGRRVELTVMPAASGQPR